MKPTSLAVFDALSLLRPYDIDAHKLRVGNERDGGYVLADLSSRASILSFGVGPDVSFESEMADQGRSIFMHDHTVEAPPQSHPKFTFLKRGVCGEGSQTFELSTIREHMAAINGEHEGFILKIDVEGWEWEVFATIENETIERFEQIVLEIHWLENLSDVIFRARYVAALKNILNQFTLFHVHANNCTELHLIDGFVVPSVLEISFVRTSLVKRRPSRTIYPSSMDKANHPHFHDHALLFYPFLPTSSEQHEIRSVVDRVDMEYRIVNR